MSAESLYSSLDSADSPPARHTSPRNRRWPAILVLLGTVGLVATAVVFLAGVGGLPGQAPEGATTTQLQAVAPLESTSTSGEAGFRGSLISAINEPACAGRGDCSSHGDCVNGECQCDDGFSGDKCQTGGEGHCVVRADCSDHGNCVNSECRCDDGFSGPRCENGGGCTIKCQHGGTPDSECKKCECLGGWKGEACEAWDDQYSVESLTQHIQTLSTAAKAELEQEMSQDMPPLPAAIGTGVNRRSGQLGLPIVSLQYDRSVVQKQWTNGKGQTYVIAAETTFESTSGQNSDFFAMRSLDQLAAKNDEMRTVNLGLAGVFGTLLTSDNAADLHAQYLSMPDRAFYLYREAHPVFKMTLPLNKGTFREYPLHPLALKGLNALPDTCESDEHKKMYQLFADTWGTSYTTSAVLGGLVEVAVRTRYCGVTDATVQGNIAQDKAMAFGGEGSAVPGYAPWRDVIKSGVIGGAAEGAQDEAAWLDSIHDSPEQISFEYGAVADLITDPAKRACMQKQVAIEDATRAAVPGAVAAAAQGSMAAYSGAKMSIHGKPINCPTASPPEQNLDMQGAQKAQLAGSACVGGNISPSPFLRIGGWNVNVFCEQDGAGNVRAVTEGTRVERGQGLFDPKEVPVNEVAGWVSTLPAGPQGQCSQTGYVQCCMQCMPLH